ncbi:hypothetical protein BRADI_5g15057v3 [Brachypodium distachyon]|uniref:Uncharacterized protein n=1 Tax=Brachypodium distachyon TaxID=15368 RepID=A0A2K2CHC3_BRADI|nr:hypothetical protein BRADI_5g15057v3 [Brachypodium distachyon]
MCRGRAQSRCSRWSYGACKWPPYLQAEGRPSSFLLVKWPYGRQFNVRLVAIVSNYGSLVAPSGFVPGDGEVDPERMLRIRLHFFFLVLGPFCNFQGLVTCV